MVRNWIGMVAVVVALGGCELGSRDQESHDPAPADAADADAVATNAAASGPADPAASEKPLAIAAAAADLKWGSCPPGMPAGCEIAVLHGDPARPNADVLLRVPGGAAIAPHWHSSAERIMLVNGRLEVKYQGAPVAVLEPDSYAYGPARLPHKAECKSAGPCTLFIAFEGPVDRHGFEGEI